MDIDTDYVLCFAIAMNEFPQSGFEIKPPNHLLAENIQEHSSSIRFSIGFAIAGLGLVGSGVAGIYSELTGKRIPVLGDHAFVTGQIMVGGAMAIGSSALAFRLVKERREFKKELSNYNKEAKEHYLSNTEKYQELALSEAEHDDVSIIGWNR